MNGNWINDETGSEKIEYTCLSQEWLAFALTFELRIQTRKISKGDFLLDNLEISINCKYINTRQLEQMKATCKIYGKLLNHIVDFSFLATQSPSRHERVNFVLILLLRRNECSLYNKQSFVIFFNLKNLKIMKQLLKLLIKAWNQNGVLRLNVFRNTS